jgi:hypothetical protein
MTISYALLMGKEAKVGTGCRFCQMGFYMDPGFEKYHTLTNLERTGSL